MELVFEKRGHVMEVQELINRAHKQAQAVPGYSYSTDVLENTIKAGFGAIPDGAVIATSGTSSVKLENNTAVSYVDGEVKLVTQIADENLRNAILVQYAVKISVTGPKSAMKFSK